MLLFFLKGEGNSNYAAFQQGEKSICGVAVPIQEERRFGEYRLARQ